MTNLQIIITAMEMNGVKEEVDTYAGWGRRGYQVKKGEKAVFKTKIWKPVRAKNKAADAAEEFMKNEDGDKLILVNASFFGHSQVAAATGN